MTQAARARVDYKTYIQSDEWKARRKAALVRSCERWSSPRCEVCGTSGYSYKNSLDSEARKGTIERANGLNVHHLHYRNLGAEPPEDLIVLCTDLCHVDRYHSARDAWMRGGRQGDPPSFPTGVGCHEKAHADPSFRASVENHANSRP